MTLDQLVEVRRDEVVQDPDAWVADITLTTHLVNTVTTPMLVKIVESGKLDARRLVTHRLDLG